MKKIKLIILIVLISLFPFSVYAVEVDEDIGGVSVSSRTCAYSWCYFASGIRVTAYKYTSSSVEYGNSVDFAVSYTYSSKKTDNQDLSILTGNSIVYYFSNWASKSKYKYSGILSPTAINSTTVTKFSKMIKNDIVNKAKCYYFCDNGYSAISVEESVGPKVLALIGINNKKKNNDSSEIINKIKDIFGLNVTKSDIDNLYLSIEPTAFIKHEKKDGTMEYYYGSAYELANYRAKTGKMYGLETVLGGNLYRSIYTPNNLTNILGIEGLSSSNKIKPVYWCHDNSEYRNFNTYDKDCVRGSKKDGSADYYFHASGSKIVTVYDSGTKTGNISHVLDKYGYGIGLYKLKDFTIDKLCKDQCKGKTGNELLKCAENYCENNATDKKTCIDSCGYSYTPLSCNLGSCPSGTNESCSNKITSSNISCYKINEYIIADCKEETNLLNYTDLPKTVGKGIGGFNYLAKLEGSKKCTLKFDTAKYQYEYAALKKNNRTGSEPVKALEYFNSLTSYSKINELDYKNELDSIKIKVDNDSKTYLLNKTDDSSYSRSSPKRNGTTHTMYEYDELKQTSKTVRDLEYSSSGAANYILQFQCLSMNNGILPVCNSTDKLKTHENYYGYYNLSKKSEKVYVYINAQKSDSCLNSNNECFYTITDGVDDDTACHIEKERNGSKYNVTMTISNINANIQNFSLNGNTYAWSKNDLSVYNDNRVITLDSFEEVQGSVTYKDSDGRSITKSCTVTNNDDGGDKTCKDIPPANKDEIRDYCNNNYSIDGYTSPTECYNHCTDGGPPDGPSDPPGEKSCKSSVRCSDYKKVKQWCDRNSSIAGYKNKSQCINDCSCGNTGSAEYIYRPIALGMNSLISNNYNAFPSREAGYNWRGFEGLTVNNSFDNEKPIYVIELDSDKIKQIRNQNVNNKSVYKDFSQYLSGSQISERKELSLESIYITSNKDIFTCRNGYGDCYKDKAGDD